MGSRRVQVAVLGVLVVTSGCGGSGVGSADGARDATPSAAAGGPSGGPTSGPVPGGSGTPSGAGTSEQGRPEEKKSEGTQRKRSASPTPTLPGQTAPPPPAVPAANDSFDMPQLVGLGAAHAKEALTGNGGFRIRWTDSSGRNRDVVVDPDWKVCTQSPAAGTAVDFAVEFVVGVVPVDESC